MPGATVPVEKPPDADEDVKLTGPDVVAFDDVDGAGGKVV